jgi:hypothetical protein
MYERYDEETADPEDRLAWLMCQIIDDDAPLRWTRYRFAAGCLLAESISRLAACLRKVTHCATSSRTMIVSAPDQDYNPWHEATVYRIKQKAKREQERRNRQRKLREMQERQTRMFLRVRGYYDPA